MEEEEQSKTRSGHTSFTRSNPRLQNLLLLWGCRPSDVVLAETKMVADIIEILNAKIDKKEHSVTLPKALDQLKGEDAQFEMVTSNTIQPLKLFYEHNVVTRKIGLVLINTGIRSPKQLEYRNALKFGDLARKTLKDLLKFDEVIVV